MVAGGLTPQGGGCEHCGAPPSLALALQAPWAVPLASQVRPCRAEVHSTPSRVTDVHSCAEDVAVWLLRSQFLLCLCCGLGNVHDITWNKIRTATVTPLFLIYVASEPVLGGRRCSHSIRGHDLCKYTCPQNWFVTACPQQQRSHIVQGTKAKTTSTNNGALGATE